MVSTLSHTMQNTQNIVILSVVCNLGVVVIVSYIFVVAVVVVVGMIHLDFFPFIYLFILCARATYKILQVHLAPSIVEVQMICHTFCLVMQMPQFS